VALTLFYRDSYNYLSTGNHTQNSSGVGISFLREFDRIDELFKKKKKKTKPAPSDNSRPSDLGARPTSTTVGKQ